MNILVLSDFFPPQVNAGAENIAFDLCKGYVQNGNIVTVITVNKSLKKGEIILSNLGSIKCYQIGFSYNEKFSAYVGLYNPFLLKIIKKIILENDFKIAHIHNIHSYISYSVIGLLQKFSIPSILTAHDALSVCYGKYDQGVCCGDISLNARVSYKANQLKIFQKNWKRYNLLRNFFIKLQFKKLKKIVCVSKELEILLNANGINNTIVIHNGLSELDKPSRQDLKKFRENINVSSNNKILLFTARISKAKGLEQVQILIHSLIKQDPNIILLVVGKEVKFDKTIQKNVINTKWLSNKEINLAYSIADITLVPSIYLDPFPTVVIESMRAGTPVIASIYSGATEAVVDGVTGYHVNPFDIKDFSDKTKKILDDFKLSNSMSNKSKEEFHKRFKLEESIQKYLELFDN